MATYWVSNANGVGHDLGVDTNDGTSPTNDGGNVGPKLTLTSTTGAWDLPLVAGDTINLINTGTPYQITTTRNLAASAALAGTDFTSNWGLRIQGTDATGAPSMTKIRFSSAGAASAISVRSGQAYILIQGLHIDRSNSSTANNNLTFILINKNGAAQAGPIKVQYCYEDNTAAKSGRTLTDATGASTPTTSIEFAYCATVGFGTNAGIAVGAATRRQIYVHNHVFVQNLNSVAQWINFGADDTTAACDHRAYNNTFVLTNGRTSYCMASTSATAHGSAQKQYYNNIFCQNGAAAGTDIFASGNVGWVGAWSGSKVVGYNVFCGTGSIAWDGTVGPYQVPWDEDNSDAAGEPDYWTTDTVSAINPFNASGTPFNWNANNAGWLLPLPGDYRVTAASGIRAAGLSGAVPGAIVEGVSPPVSVDDEYAVNYDTTLNQSAPGVLANDSDPDGDPLVAILVTDVTPTVAGTLTFNSDGSFIFVPTSGYIGDATFTYKAYDGFFYSTPSTVTIHVYRPPSTVLGSASLIGANTPGKIVPDATMRLFLNSFRRFEQEYRPADPLSVTAAHVSTATVVASTTDAVLSLGSTTTATALHIVTDQDVTLKINNGPTLAVMAGGCLQIVGCSITSLKITNASTIRSANVTYMVVS